MKGSSARKRHATRASLAQATKLPPLEGPKLHKFEHSGSPIRWIERIDAVQEDTTGVTAYVFRVEILRKEYAIKIFKPFDSGETRWRYETIMHRKVNRQNEAYLISPFFAECRAYGRLNEKECRNSASRVMVARCHGFLFLTQTDEEALHAYNIDLETNNLDEHDFTRRPIAAVVKDLIEPTGELQKAHFVKILRGICALQDHGVFNQDIRSQNFVSGQLVDFGSSFTRPHEILDSLLDGYRTEILCAALVMFDDMIEENNVDFPFQTYPVLTGVEDGSGKYLETCDRMLLRRSERTRTRGKRKFSRNDSPGDATS